MKVYIVIHSNMFYGVFSKRKFAVSVRKKLRDMGCLNVAIHIDYIDSRKED